MFLPFRARATADAPASIAEPLAVTTGPDGTASLAYLGAGDQLVAVRVTADSIGTQDLQLVERLGRQRPGSDDHNTPPADEPADRPCPKSCGRTGREPNGRDLVQGRHFGAFAAFPPPSPIGFKNGPVRTAADGSFQTPDNLLIGSSYRVVVRAPGTEPILSDWITIGDKPRVLLPMIQRPLRTISGRAVDRQGKPVAGVEVFQSGDGPERTSTTTDADGRFTLEGFRQGPVFLFVRGEGFRFFGRLIRPGENGITVELTRTSERPAREMKMLPDPIPLEESRALARRLMEPYWEAAVKQKNQLAQNRALRSLAAADPAGVLQKLDAPEFAHARMKSVIQRQVAETLAWTDPTEAEAVAEAIDEPAPARRPW